MDKEVIERLVKQHKYWFGEPKPHNEQRKKITKEEMEAKTAQERAWAAESFEKIKTGFGEVADALKAAGYEDLMLITEVSDHQLELAVRNVYCVIVVRQNQDWYDFKTELSAKITGLKEERYFCNGPDQWSHHDFGPASKEDLDRIPTQNELDKGHMKYNADSLVDRFISLMQRAKAQEKA